MAHRGELLKQASDKLKEASGLDYVPEKAESSSLDSFLPVTVSSVQSLAQEKKLARFPNYYFQDIIADEAHHCLSDSYRRALDHFTTTNILGVTATPNRGDMKNHWPRSGVTFSRLLRKWQTTATAERPWCFCAHRNLAEVLRHVERCGASRRRGQRQQR